MGIAGVEGGQAVQNADFALSQFRFLQRLLLVHGRWSYRRVSLFLHFFLFKTVSFALVHIWFAFYNGYSAQVRLHLVKHRQIINQEDKRLPVLQSLYEMWNIAFYTVFYTSVPVMLVAYFEQVRQLFIFIRSYFSCPSAFSVL